MTHIRRTAGPIAPPATNHSPATKDVKRPAATRTQAVDSGDFRPADPETVMRRFYDAFTNRRFDEVERLYAPDVRFKDLVFEYDDRQGTMRMWRKLIGPPGGEYRFEFDRVEGDVAYGRWVADYKLLGRPVHNELETRMVIRDGQIVEHVDTADWAKWARQALPLGRFGATGLARALITPALRLFVNHA